MMTRPLLLMFLIGFALPLRSLQAQEAPEPVTIVLEANSSARFAGDFYMPDMSTPPAQGVPTVVIFHQIGSNRTTARPLVPALLDAGYAVLAIDSPGSSEETGPWVTDESAILDNIRLWTAWLGEQPGVRDDAIAMIGSSIGCIQALAGCADDANCMTAVAISTTYTGSGIAESRMQDAMNRLRGRSILLLAGAQDMRYAGAVRELVGMTRGELGVRIFPAAEHGEGLFTSSPHREQVIRVIVDWLTEHMPD